VVHVATPLVRADRVELLAMRGMPSVAHVDDLGLAALETTPSVGHREEVDLGRERRMSVTLRPSMRHALITIRFRTIFW